jgi:serine phosphatase RsbU (regulator of sigma subunit)
MTTGELRRASSPAVVTTTPVSTTWPATTLTTNPVPNPGAGTPHGRRTISWVSLVVLIIGVAITASVSWTTAHLNRNNEERLLRLETKQAATVLSAIVPTIQTPLSSAAGIATRNPDSAAARFRAYIASYVGPKQPFGSASLWQVSGQNARLVLSVGGPPQLAGDPAQASKFLAAVKPGAQFSIVGPLGTVAKSRLGYAVAGTGTSSRFVVYSESPLPPGRRAVVPPGSAFSDLRFALYLGQTPGTDRLLETNSKRLPISGRIANDVIPFGNSALLVVAAPARSLGGPVAADMWWILALGGGLLALAAGATAEGLVRRRLAAERLTAEVQHLLGEQRTIAETLQHALLPDVLPEVAGVEADVRYLPGTNGVDIGGDWYDLMPLDEGRFFFVVGDVSGRGVLAGSVMAALRFAIRAFVSEGHPPAAILDSLCGMLDVADDHHFATVVCGIADPARHEVVIANAGHPPPLCVTPDSAGFLDTPVGVPIGVPSKKAYRAGTITVPSGGTLLIYTDGLIERRGENLDEGLERLRSVALSAATLPVGGMLDTVVSELAHAGLDDDTAIMGVRWLS